MNEWELQPRSDACNGCQKPFEAQQPYHTLLTFRTEGYCRQDLCANCWATAKRAGVISQWQGIYQPPAPRPAETVRKETAESLLRKLMASNDPTHAHARYILAVMLERKRILKPREKSNGEDGKRVLFYEHAKTGESFVIPDPGLRLDQLGETQRQIAALLGAPESTMTAPGDIPTPQTNS